MTDLRSAAPAFHLDGEWEVVHVPTGNVVTTYDTEAEATDAIEWLGQWRQYEGKLEVRHAA